MSDQIINSALSLLTKREREILLLVIAGDTSKTIAKKLSISFRTVEVHRARIKKKTGASNMVELLEVVFAERDEFENKFIQSEKRFSRFLNSLPVIAFIKNEDGKLIFCNTHLEESLGITNWHGKTVLELFPREIAMKMGLDDQIAIREGRLVTEEKVPNKNGEVKIYQTYKFPIPIHNLRPLIGGISLDITERRIAEIALDTTRSQLVESQQLAHLGSWTWEIASGKNYWSDEQYRIYGYEPGSIIPSHDLFINTVAIEDRPKVEKTLLKSIENRNYFNMEFRINRPDGTVRTILSRGKVTQKEDKKSYVMTGSDLDITDIKLAQLALAKSEEKLSTIYNTSHIGIAISRISDGKFLDANPGFLNLHGYSSEEIIGHTSFEKNLWVDWDQRQKIMTRLIVQRKVLNNEVVCRHKSGEVFTSLISFHLIEIENEPCVLTILTDITERKEIEERLKISEERYRSLVEDQSELICRFKEDGTIIFANEAYCRYFGIPKEKLIGSKWEPTAHKEDLNLIQTKLSTLSPTNPVVTIENRVINGLGELRWAEFTNSAFFSNDGKLIEMQSVGRDTTDRKKIEENLQQLTIDQYAILDNELIGIMKTADRHIIWNNKAFSQIFGFESGEVLGKSTRVLYPNNTSFQQFCNDAEMILSEGKPYRKEFELNRKDKEKIWVEIQGLKLSGNEFLWMITDISDIKKRGVEIEFLAYHDNLTGLANRMLIFNRIKQSLAQATLRNQTLAVCYLDVDRFKNINDTYGHTAGDQLLKELANRIERSIRPNDSVGRVGGDEFLLLLTNLDNDHQYRVIAERVLEAINEPMTILGLQEIKIGASIGIALYPTDGVDIELLIRCADRALYHAKQSGRNCIRIYMPEIHDIDH